MTGAKSALAYKFFTIRSFDTDIFRYSILQVYLRLFTDHKVIRRYPRGTEVKFLKSLVNPAQRKSAYVNNTR